MSSSPASPPAKARASTLPEGYVCSLCCVPGHWRADCAKSTSRDARDDVSVSTRSPSGSSTSGSEFEWPREAASELVEALSIQVPIGSSSDAASAPPAPAAMAPTPSYAQELAQILLREQDMSSARVQATIPSEGYVCRRCGVPGHWLVHCTKYNPPSAASVRAAASNAKAKPWRCEPCNKSFKLESQQRAHFKQHVTCSYSTCSFSAAKRVVTEHMQTCHGSSGSLTVTPASGCTPTSLVNPLLADGCAICLVSSHRTYDCELLPKPTTPLPDEHCCEICGVSGHWIFYCPVVLATLPPLALPRESTEQETATVTLPPSLPVVETPRTLGAPPLPSVLAHQPPPVAPPLPLAPQQYPEPALSLSPQTPSAAVALPSTKSVDSDADSGASAPVKAAMPHPSSSSKTTSKGTSNGLFIAPWLLKAGPPPASYRCKACGDGGHYIYECAKRLPRAELAARSAAAAQDVTAAEAADESKSLASASVEAQATTSPPSGSPVSAPARPDRSAPPPSPTIATATATTIRRCETCDLVFRLDSQLASHYRDHVVCGYAGCGFSAVKRRVTEHAAAAHPLERGAAMSPVLPPANLLCTVCNEGGHWPNDCPKLKLRQSTGGSGAVKSGASTSSVPAVKPPDGYVCKRCGVPGHWFNKCAKYNPPSAASVRAAVSNAKAKPWRCEPCNKSFKLESQQRAHFKQHYVCGFAGCDFAASKTLVNEHAAAAHASTVASSATTPMPMPVAAASTTPPKGYVCKLCSVPGHWFTDCKKFRRPKQPFKCATCDEAFALKALLVTHMSQHAACPYAGCSFSASKKVMKRHAATAHGTAQQSSVSSPLPSPTATAPRPATSASHTTKPSARVEVEDAMASTTATAEGKEGGAEEVVVVLGQRYVMRAVTVDGREHMRLVSVPDLGSSTS